MNIIFKLTIQYMKKNRRRTKAAIVGITCMMVVLTAVFVFSEAFLGVIRNRIVEEDGAYRKCDHL